MQGTVLTFFAFIGFEDSLNVAEECKEPERTIPIGLLTAMGIVAIFYVAVAITAVSVVPWADLAAAPGPLTEVIRRAAPAIPSVIFTAITLFAVSGMKWCRGFSCLVLGVRLEVMLFPTTSERSEIVTKRTPYGLDNHCR